MAGDFNSSVSATVRTSGKMSIDIEAYSSTISHQAGTYRTLHPITAQCTFFLNKLGNFVKMNHFLDRKARIHKFMNNSSNKKCVL